MRPTGSIGSRPRGLSLIEVVLGAVILGLSGVTILELVRSNTVNLQITEVEAVARGLAADTLERFSRRATYNVPAMAKLLRKMQSTPLGWRDVVEADASLRYQFPTADLSKLLDQYDVKLRVQIKTNQHASFGPKPRMRQVEVEVKWTDPKTWVGGPPVSELRTVSYVALSE